MAQFPSAAAELWPWCLAQTQDRLLELLAFCAAAIVDGVVLPHKDSSDAAKVEHANQLAAALQMDMRDWFTPTVENFFGRVSKLQIANALTEAGNPLQPQDSKTQKGELAAIAAKKINDGQEAGHLARPLDGSPFQSFRAHFSQFRQYTPKFIEAFQFEGIPSQKPMLRGLEILRQMNRLGQSVIPTDAPRSFVKPKWAHSSSPTMASIAATTSFAYFLNSVLD